MNLHCGACNQNFDTTDDLQAHIPNCSAAKAILLPYTALVFGAKDDQHLVGHMIFSIPESRHIIAEYAEAVAGDLGSLERALIHRRLCSRFGLEYSTFRPFESSAIKKIPTKAEAEVIIYEALGWVMRETLFGLPKEST